MDSLRFDLAQDGFGSIYVAGMLAQFDPIEHSAKMRGTGKDPCDPRDLIHEAFRIDGIRPEECRAIFFDWALGLDPGMDVVAAAKSLHAALGATNPDHPMTALLAEAAAGSSPQRSRRGRRRRS